MNNNLPKLDTAINVFEDASKSAKFTNKDLRDNLAFLLSKAGYNRPPYHMIFERLIRGRSITATSIDEACNKLNSKETLSYPKEAKLVKASRCNSDGNPVFYCAIDTGVPIFEIRAELGQYVVITTFKHKSKPKIEIDLPIIGVEQIYESLKKRNPNDPTIKMLEHDICFSDKDIHQKVIQFDRMLAGWFSQKVNNDNNYIYRLTNALYEMYIHHTTIGNDKVKGLIYPSIESEITGYNIALQTDFVDEFLEVDEATIYQVVRKVEKKYASRQLKQIQAIDANGQIIWDDYLWHLEPSSPSFSYGEGANIGFFENQ